MRSVRSLLISPPSQGEGVNDPVPRLGGRVEHSSRVIGDVLAVVVELVERLPVVAGRLSRGDHLELAAPQAIDAEAVGPLTTGEGLVVAVVVRAELPDWPFGRSEVRVALSLFRLWDVREAVPGQVARPDPASALRAGDRLFGPESPPASTRRAPASPP